MVCSVLFQGPTRSGEKFTLATVYHTMSYAFSRILTGFPIEFRSVHHAGLGRRLATGQAALERAAEKLRHRRADEDLFLGGRAQSWTPEEHGRAVALLAQVREVLYCVGDMICAACVRDCTQRRLC